MLGFSILSNLFSNLIATGIVKEVFHSVTIRQQGPDRKPAAPVNNHYEYVGVDDTQGFTCYCRPTGPLESTTVERAGSCGQNIHITSTPHRIVFFHDREERNHDDITGQLMKAVLKSGNDIRFQRIHTDIQSILQQEAPTGRFTFTPLTYYTAIDFLVVLKLQTDNCEEEIKCKGVQNPYC